MKLYQIKPQEYDGDEWTRMGGRGCLFYSTTGGWWDAETRWTELLPLCVDCCAPRVEFPHEHLIPVGDW